MNKITRLAASLVFAAIAPPSICAVATDSKEVQLRALTQRAEALELESKNLHNQILTIQGSKKGNGLPTPSEPKKRSSPSSAATMNAHAESDLSKMSPQVIGKIHQTAINYIHGVTVTTSPILGLKSAWNPSDLLYAIPSMNQDLQLLQDRLRFQKLLESLGSTLDTRPLLVFSGGLESTLTYIRGYNDQNRTDLNLITGEVDLWAVISSWASGFITIEYDDSPPQTGSRVTNSRLFLQRGFFTIGNLAKTPFYLTMGQMFVPFGRYASAMVTTPLTKSLGRIEARDMLVGYYSKGWYTEGYGFKGDRSTQGSRIIFQGGVNAGYQNADSSIGSIDAGVGYVSNIADSQGMQGNGLSPGLGFPSNQFAGFSDTVIGSSVDDRVTSDNLKHNVPGANVHVEYGRGIFALISEFSGAVTSFNAGDLLYNNQGASPKAMHLEMDLNFKIGVRPLTIGAAYGETWEALPLNLPKQSYFAVVSTSFWKDTAQSLEYRHDVNYSVMPSSSVGGGGNGNINNVLPVPSANLGGTQDLITFLFGIYF